MSGLTCTGECEQPAATKINGGPETTSLNLPIEETPYYNETDSPWIDVTSGPFCGGSTGTPCAAPNSGNDSAPGINAALASAPPGSTAFLKRGLYQVNEAINIPQNVVRLVCYGATLRYGTTLNFNATSPNSLQILAECDSVHDDSQGSHIVNNSPGTVVIKDVDAFVYSNTPSSHGGKVFIENMDYGPFTITNETVYARQLDPEFPNTPGDGLPIGPHVTVQGGLLWVLGYKQEANTAALDVSSGAQVEVLGGAILAEVGTVAPGPMIVNTGARMSAASMATGIAGNGGDFDQWIQETQSGSCASGCSATAPYARPGFGSVMSLYIGYP